MEREVKVRWRISPWCSLQEVHQAVLVVEGICSCICTIYNNGLADVMLVDNVRVEEEWRRRGWGTALMKRALSLAKEYRVDAVELVVNNDNEAAQNLYWNVGFRKTDKAQYRVILNARK